MKALPSLVFGTTILVCAFVVLLYPNIINIPRKAAKFLLFMILTEIRFVNSFKILKNVNFVFIGKYFNGLKTKIRKIKLTLFRTHDLFNEKVQLLLNKNEERTKKTQLRRIAF